MKNLFLILSMLFIFIANAYSQAGDSEITIQKKRYYQNGETKTFPEIKKVLAANPASAPEFKKYKSNAMVGTPLLVAGSLCLVAGAGINLASSIKEANDVNNGELGGSYPNGLPIIILGAGLDIIGLPFLISANKHLKKSLGDYNSSIKGVSHRPVQFNMMLRTDGVGVRMWF